MGTGGGQRMKTIEAGGKIDKGKLVIFGENVFLQQIQDIGFVNHVHIILEYGNKRTLNQNAYAWHICNAISTRLRQDGHEVDKDMVYRKIEETYCTKKILNPTNGKYEDWTTPLKKKDADEFEEITDTVRNKFNSNYPDAHIKTPPEYYGMTLEKYNAWKRGKISRTEAIKG